MRRTTVAALSLLVLAGCADRQASALQIASSAGLSQTEISTSTFSLMAFTRMQAPSAPLVVYIEGDGLAWKSRSEPSLDPTPRNPISLKLAALDQSPNVAYLARPCQYTKGDANCRADYWTGKRFSEEVVASVDQAITKLADKAGAKAIHLVGYSGGGALAVLVAARRSDIASIRTVAGNLDSEEINRLHGVSAMPASLNPADVAAKIARIPQTHYVGAKDTVVPPAIADGFVRKSGGSSCVSIVKTGGASHDEGWDALWPQAVTRIPACAISSAVGR